MPHLNNFTFTLTVNSTVSIILTFTLWVISPVSLGGTEVTHVRHTGRYGGHAGQAHWEVQRSHRSGTLGCSHQIIYTTVLCRLLSEHCTKQYFVVQCRAFSPQSMYFPIVWRVVFATTNLKKHNKWPSHFVTVGVMYDLFNYIKRCMSTVISSG